MDYPYENLSPEKFQEFCQALLLKAFPGVQCFPVGQPDGGRDAVGYYLGEKTEGFVVYQIKFVRQPSSLHDATKWVTDTIAQEIPKIKKHIPLGVRQYVLITNVRGTGHFESGSIDKMNKIVSKLTKVTSMCWWRDDLNRRLDGQWDLKWAYPELMTGPDLIKFVVESGVSDARERRMNAVKAFAKDQYNLDLEVKFKQVELQNKLLDLFIDVPIVPPREGVAHRKHVTSHYIAYRYLAHSQSFGFFDISESKNFGDAVSENFASEDEVPVGAATFLLHSIVQSQIPRVVLEGAPGQGKSTIAQYVCQVHRMRLLAKSDMLAQLPEHHRACPVRLPFKIDLRDLATWLSRKNPFTPEAPDSMSNHWTKSLESFMAAQVRHHSGGTDFDVNDLLAISKVTSLLLVFDGLDEVADISQRQEVVDEIVKGVNRLEENAASVQVLVTSRPAAFANSPGLPEEAFPYLGLDSVTRPLIDEYANKWLRARKLQSRESAEVKNILRSKLDQPHLRDLARNPMQLAILLSLIHTRGSSLPDKRTSLYDSYIELFFNREAEKSHVVRDHRDLLINIHRFLAWVLHKEAEVGGNSGSIREDDLHRMLKNYLMAEGHDPDLSRILFTGMVERVVALVSRVQGTYEFEVQPLREYFAARYLYETAPYSPPGRERSGTKPDRFNAIARNFYWLNVTRFYAGCYSKGELASLIDSLEDLIGEEGYRLISYPRILAATLLSDWVFSQHPKSVQEALSLVVDGLGLRYLLSGGSRRMGLTPLPVLAKPCGREELVGRCFELLRGCPSRDFALGLIEIIGANSTPTQVSAIWFDELVQKEGAAYVNWIEYGVQLGIIADLPLDELEGIAIEAVGDSRAVEIICRAQRFDVMEKTEDFYENFIDLLLARDIRVITIQRGVKNSVLGKLGESLSIFRYRVIFDAPDDVPLSAVFSHGRVRFAEKEDLNSPFPGYLRAPHEFLIAVDAQAARSVKEWTTSLQPWDAIVEKGRSLWGDRWAFYCLAVMSSIVSNRAKVTFGTKSLSDHAISLCERAYHARTRATSSRWWLRQLQSVKDDFDFMFFVDLLLLWGNAELVLGIFGKIDGRLAILSDLNWGRLAVAVEELAFWPSERLGKKTFHISAKALPRELSIRGAVLLGLRADLTTKKGINFRYLKNYAGDDAVVMRFCCDLSFQLLLSGEADWDFVLRSFSHAYLSGAISDAFLRQRSARHDFGTVIPLSAASAIAENPDRYPDLLLTMAEAKCKENVASSVVPVGVVAEREKWFN